MIRRSALALAAAAIVLAALLPATSELRFPELDYGLLVIHAGAAGAGVLLAWFGSGLDAGDAAPGIRTVALWSGCFVAVAGSLVAVATHAQTLELRNLVAAQQNTRLYALQQPVAATLFLLALALASEDQALATVFGPVTRSRDAALIAAALGLGGLGATVFLGGYAGPGLPAPLWLVVKGVFLAAVLLVARRALAALEGEARVMLAWSLVPVSAINLAVTMGVLTS